MKLPHIFRFVSRTVVIFVILSFFVFSLFDDSSSNENLKTSIRPDDFRTGLSKADFYLSRGDVKGAETVLNNLLIFRPTNVFVLEKLSKINDQQELYFEITRIEETIKKRPDYQAAWIKLANLYENVGRDDLAKEARLRAAKLTTI